MFTEVDKMLQTCDIQHFWTKLFCSSSNQIVLKKYNDSKKLNGVMLSYIHQDRLDSIDLNRIAIAFTEGHETRQHYFGHF